MKQFMLVLSFSSSSNVSFRETGVVGNGGRELGRPVQKDWCCVIDEEYASRCGSCPYPEQITAYYIGKNMKLNGGNFQGKFKKERGNSDSGSWHRNYEDPLVNLSSIESESNARKMLGLEKDERIDLEKIKKSFKKVALKLHPDRETGNEERFKELIASYELLLAKYNNSKKETTKF